MRTSTWLRLALGLAGWTLVGVFLAAQAYVGSVYAGSATLPWPQALAIGLAAWYVRAALSPIACRLARQAPVVRGNVARQLALHLGAGVAWSAAATFATQWVLMSLVDMRGRALPAAEFYTSLLTYAVLVGVTQTIDSQRRRRDQEIAASRLEARLATARLDLLRMQLNPHFVVDALRDISTLMREDVDRAQLKVEELCELLQLSLRYAGEPEVPLSAEVGFLRRYLDLEQMRFRDRLEPRVEVESARVHPREPQLVLQPLVEKAAGRVGIPRLERGSVDVRGRADGEALVLEVYDDSPGEIRLELPLRGS